LILNKTGSETALEFASPTADASLDDNVDIRKLKTYLTLFESIYVPYLLLAVLQLVPKIAAIFVLI